jgi:hypothetical protein
MMPKTDEDYGLRAALWAVALTGLVLTLAAPFAIGPAAVVGVALGASIAFVNLWSLARIVRAFINGAGLPWVLLAALKLLALVAIVAFVLKLGWTTVIPLAVGYGALPLGIVLAQLKSPRPDALEATSPSYVGEIDADSRRKG